MPEGAMLGSLAPLYAELLLAVGAMALLMFGVFAGDRAAPTVTGASIALLSAALLLLVVTEPNGMAFEGAFLLDPFARLMKVLTLAASAVAIAMSVGYARSEGFERFEYPVLIVIATLGMMMMVSANDMIALYLALELQSLPLYVVAAIHRDSVRSTEAGLKYFVLGALSSGMLLYGISLVYGFTGNTGFADIAVALQDGRSTGLVIGLVFVLAGLAFKISAVPFHMWAPDVYEGAPTPVTAFFAAAPKLAAMGLLIRVVVGPFEPVTPDWQQVLAFVAVASMVLGAFAAIGQTNIKRLMAYSSIGHMGYALVGLAAGSEAGVQGVIVYIIIYLAMTLGAFACILAMRRGGGMVEEIAALSGLARTRPTTAFLLAAILFSLAGIPPLAGFFAKYYVFLAAIEKGLYLLAVIGVVASVIGAYYYVRIVKIMYFDEPDATLERMPLELKAVLVVTGVFIIAFPFVAAPVVDVAGTAAASLFVAGAETADIVN